MVSDVTCCICDEIASSEQSELHQRYSGIKDRKLYENKLFILLPSISPIGEGHFLIFSREHISSFSQLPSNEGNKLREFVGQVCDSFREKYESLIIFEHGVGRGISGGCGISHAHIHLLPSSLNETKYVQTSLVKQGYVEINTSFDKLREICGDRTYLFVGENVENISVYLSGNFASQTIRKMICEYRSIDNWDWKYLDNWAVFKDNYANGRDLFSSEKGV